MTFENGRLRPFTNQEIEDLFADPHAIEDLARVVKNIHFIRHAQN